MKSTRQCPKCQSKDIRYEVLQLDHVNPQQYGGITFAVRDIAGWRLYDTYVCGGCGFTEFYFRTWTPSGTLTQGGSSARP